MSADALLAEVLEAHGGLERWRAATEITARVRSGGLLLASRAPRGLFADYRIRVEVAEQRVEFGPQAVPERASFDRGRVRIVDADGNTISERADPRPLFFGRSGLRRNLRWDALDTAYFAGYAMWNYLTTPLLLTRAEVEVSEGRPWTAPRGERWRRLDARFDPSLHTHSARQTFWVGGDSLLRRHDYTAEVVGGWARAAHRLERNRECAGLVFPTRRRVVPRGPANRGLPGPTLVWIELTDMDVATG
ncbi:MAG TPA: hypothetical protein VFY99_02270 [Solirubrobacterales bacterium]